MPSGSFAVLLHSVQHTSNYSSEEELEEEDFDNVLEEEMLEGDEY